MTWVQRVGNIARMSVLVGLELIALFTEANKLLAQHLDSFIDDLQEKLTTGQPPATPP